MKVFISYAREDESAATRIYDSLAQMPGVIPWLDSKCLLPADDWKREITHAIQDSDLVLLLLSSSSVDKTGYIQREVREALDAVLDRPPDCSYLLPARLDRCEPKFPELRRLHWADLFQSWEDGIETIRRAIAKKQERGRAVVMAHDKLQMKKNANDAARILRELPLSIREDLHAYSDWLLRHDYSTYPYADARKNLPNWTCQSKDEWRVYLFEVGILSKPSELGEFTDVGLELIELLESSDT